ncbi:hypothetical protein D3C78_1334670 [compost metagenome]
MHAFGIGFAAQARSFESLDDATQQLGTQVFVGTLLAAAEDFEQRMVHMLGSHGFDRLALQVMARLARGHGREVARRAGMDGQRHLQTVTVERFGLGIQQVLENTALHGQRRFTEQLGIEIGQLQQHGVLAAGRASALALGRTRCGLGRTFGRRTIGCRTRRTAAAAAPATGLAGGISRC